MNRGLIPGLAALWHSTVVKWEHCSAVRVAKAEFQLKPSLAPFCFEMGAFQPFGNSKAEF